MDDNSLWDTFDDTFNDDKISVNDSDNDNDNDNYSDNDSEIDLEYGCNTCKQLSLMYKDGNHVCTNCGEIQTKRLTHEAEYRFYGDCDNKTINPERVGLPTNYMLPESSLGSLIKQRPSDNSTIKRMVQYNTWHQMPYKERSLYKICCKIATCCKIHGLPTIIIERSKEFYNIIREVNISRGDNRDGIIAACVYFACKDEKVPRSSKEIANYFKIKLQDMTRGIKKFRESWRLAKNENDTLEITSSNPIDFIERYCSNLPITTNIKHIAEFVAIKSIFLNIVSDNTAPSIAAGSIYLTCYITNQSITKKMVANACKTSEVTISKCFKKLNELKHELLPAQIKLDYNITN